MWMFYKLLGTHWSNRHGKKLDSNIKQMVLHVRIVLFSNVQFTASSCSQRCCNLLLDVLPRFLINTIDLHARVPYERMHHPVLWTACADADYRVHCEQ